MEVRKRGRHGGKTKAAVWPCLRTPSRLTPTAAILSGKNEELRGIVQAIQMTSMTIRAQAIQMMSMKITNY